MSHHRHIIFSFLCIFQISVSNNSASQNQNYDSVRLPFAYALELRKYFKKNPEVLEYLLKNANNENLDQQTESTNETFSKEEIEEMERVFQDAPVRARYIVNHLQDPTFFPNNEDYRSAFFVGETGSGKTTTAKAIGRKLAELGWKVEFLSSTSLLGEHRNQTAIKLQRKLKEIVASDKPTIIIIDELHRLLENAESKHHDTDTSATELWTFLDRQQNNKKIFFIGTMNRITKLPKPFKDRILFDSIEFKPITDFTIKKNKLREYLTTQSTRLDAEVTDDFLYAELQKMGPCSARNLKKLSKIICQIQSMDTTEKTPILALKKASIIKAREEYISLKEKFQYDVEEETDEQRQERHHKESEQCQERHHKENQQLQERHHKENMDLQEQHFVLQHMLQVYINNNQGTELYIPLVSPNNYTLSLDAVQRMSLLFSDEQKKLYEAINAKYGERYMAQNHKK